MGTAERGAQSADLNGIAQRRACAMHCHRCHMPRVDFRAGQCGPYHRLQAYGDGMSAMYLEGHMPVCCTQHDHEQLGCSV